MEEAREHGKNNRSSVWKMTVLVSWDWSQQHLPFADLKPQSQRWMSVIQKVDYLDLLAKKVPHYISLYNVCSLQIKSNSE